MRTSILVLLFACLVAARFGDEPLRVVYRDFLMSHSDFQGITSIHTGLGLLESNLGLDNTPVRTSVPYSTVINFPQWYHDVPGVNMRVDYLADGVTPTTLPFTAATDHRFYRNGNFFPINGRGFGSDNPNDPDNNLFTFEGHSTFLYSGADWLKISADDDVWVYVNHKLVCEAHCAWDVNCPLDGVGMLIGGEYNIDIFFAERQYTGSYFGMDTNIGLTPISEPQIDECPFPLPVILNALAWPDTCTDNSIGATCEVKCLIGGGVKRSTLCQENGTWIVPEDCPVCPPETPECPFPVLGTVPCSSPPSHPGLGFTCPLPDAQGLFATGVECDAICVAPTQELVNMDAPKAVCYNGRWNIHAVCVGAWPYTQDKDCSLPPIQAGQSVATPEYFVDEFGVRHMPEIVETGNFPGFFIDGRDHLFLDFGFSASYRVVNITGGALGTKNIIVDLGTAFDAYDTLDLWYQFSYPTGVDCRGRLQMRIAIGYLQDWGFTLQKETTGVDADKWTLTGEFFATEARMTYTSEAWEEQQVVANFPIKIVLADTLNVDLDCDLKVYGTPNASVSIIMFVESKYPDQELIVWFLVAHQFPFWMDEVLAAGIAASDDVEVIDGPTMAPYKGVNFCDADDTSNSEPMYCYQIVKVKFHNKGVCTATHPVTYSGTSFLYWNVACRKIPHVDPITSVVTWEEIDWCILPPQYEFAQAFFPLQSNDICRVTLNWDPTIDVTTHMVQTAAMNPSAGIADLQGQCCGFVADNDAFFLIYLTDNKVNHNIIFDKMTLLNITLTVGTAAPVVLYANGVWNAAPALVAVIVDPIIRCNNDNSANCKIDQPFYSMDAFPYLGFTLHLDPDYLGLRGAVVSKKLKILCWMSIDYALPDNTEIKTKIFASEKSLTMPGTSLYINAKSQVFHLPSAGSVSTSTGSVALIAGVAAGAVCVAAAAVVGVLIYRKKSASKHAKLEETTA